MHTRELQIARLIHENCGVRMTFAFSQYALDRMTERFRGEWKYLHKMCFELPQVRAERAALELAIHLRVLDDEQDLAADCERSRHHFGTLVKKDGSTEPLIFREVTNKIHPLSSFRVGFSGRRQAQIDLPASRRGALAAC